MARPLRILLAGGWYHVTSRGNRRQAIYRTDPGRRRFMGLVAELPERLGVDAHAFVLMGSHQHLLLPLPEPHQSDALRWLHVRGNSRFNPVHHGSGRLGSR
jgi:REP element-mobilizing transposase RayT